MKQLIQNFKSGELYVDELPEPAIAKGMVLVSNAFSLISAGTEKGTVGVGQASLLGKAKQRPDLVKQVFQNYRKEGLRATIEKVTTKLDSLKALGYSSAGTVLASMDTNNIYKIGDRVSCAGQDYASHAGVVSIPQNLVAHIPDNVSFEEASFTTVGAIALQGVRQAEPTLGEKICVIGLGLLGQLTCQLLNANGCSVLGIDLSQASVDLCNELGYAKAYNRSESNLITILNNFTFGYGFDKVIITAAAPSNDPVVLSTEILRKKGVIIIVGSVAMEIPREPYFYKKELELKISCSYGPGRYDVNYEEFGHDYPIGYVRWTEQRNMQAFLDLIGSGAIDVKPLITHIFDIEESTKAFDIILGKIQEPFIGILIKYPQVKHAPRTNIIEVNPSGSHEIKIGFIGAGSFAQSALLPTAKKLGSLETVVTRTGINSKNVAQKFGFSKSSTEPENIFKNDEINTVFIVTQHNTHASYLVEAIKNRKAIFVEKPMALTKTELIEIVKAYESSEKRQILVGFNRRFAAISVKSKAAFANIGEPLTMNFRINAGYIPKEHWSQTEAGGGRILGEICHWIDLMQFYTNAEPVRVFAECIDNNNNKLKNDDNIIITVKFSDGSVGSISYFANGDKALSKERIEVFGGNVAFVNNDFQKGYLYFENKETTIKLSGKGHKEEVSIFLDAVQNGKVSPITFRSQVLTTLTTFGILDSLSTGLPQHIVYDF